MSRHLATAGILLGLAGLLGLCVHLVLPLPDALQFFSRAAFGVGIVLFLLVRVSTALMGQDRTDSLSVSLLLLFVTLMVGLVMCEAVLRFSFRNVTTSGDFNSIFSARWRQGVYLNPLGFRDADIPAPKPANSYRIAVVGDSFTYGQGVSNEERFTDLLRDRLNDGTCKDVQFEVINLGRPGAETIDHLAILQEVALQLEPDFILLQWYKNDMEGADKSGRPRPMRLIPSDYLSTLLRENSVLYFLIQSRWATLQSSLGWEESYEDYMRQRFLDPDSPDSQAASGALADFFSTNRTHDLPVGMILFPDAGGPAGLTFLHDRVLAQCADEKILCVDLQEAYAEEEDPRTLWASALDHHPSALAHAMATDLLVEAFLDDWHAACVGGQPMIVPATR